MIFDDSNSQVTLAPRSGSTIYEIPRTVPIAKPMYNNTSTRNNTGTYQLGITSAFVGLYTVVSLMGAEGIALGVLFGLGFLAFKNRDVSTTDATKSKRLQAEKLAAEYDVNSSATSLLENLQLNGSQPVVIIKMD